MFFWNKKKPKTHPKTSKKVIQFKGTYLSDTGKKRTNNEDQCLLNFSNHTSTCQAILADGMGGHNAGEVASELAVQFMFYRMSRKDKISEESMFDFIIESNRAIFEQSLLDASQKGMGTTLTACHISQDRLIWGHVGDSRLYHYSSNNLIQITTDDTLNQKFKDEGLRSSKGTEHILLKALGTKEVVTPSTGSIILDTSIAHRFLLCSDGLTDLVDDNSIQDILSITSAKLAAESLVALANQRGGKDNVSVIVFDVNLQEPIIEKTTKEIKLS